MIALTISCRRHVNASCDKLITEEPKTTDDKVFPSLDVVYDQMQARIATQDAQVAALDTKANFTLTAATILVAGLGSFTHNLVTPGISSWWSGKAAAICFSILLYLALTICVIQAHRVRTMDRVPEPRPLLDNLTKSAAQTKHELADAMVHAFERNHVKIEHKANLIIASEWLLLLEAFWIGVIVAVHLLH